MAVNHWWELRVPHWLLGSANLVLSAVAVGVPLGGRYVVDTPIGDFLEILWGLSILPGLIVPILYLRSYPRISLFFSTVA
jgi:hypothetical protein